MSRMKRTVNIVGEGAAWKDEPLGIGNDRRMDEEERES